VIRRLTLQTVSTAKTRIERKFEADVVRELKAGATRDVAVGGPALVAHAIRADLVDEYHLLVAPIIAGSGNPYLPGKVSVKLELLDERRFDNGMIHVQYRAKS
jgi:dihydrofolate reductase